MKLVTYQTNIPEENIAVDEVLLSKAELGGGGETLRFWESDEYFVVLGKGCKLEEECLSENCKKDRVKIIRRISGGGTVLQGKGCINYSLILSYESSEEFKNIKSSYKYLLGEICNKFNENGCEVEVKPISDIIFKDKKVSGNAQCRKKKYFLHHGTILYNFDIDRISKYLKYPPNEPDYRKGRSHKDFVVNINIEPEKIIKIFKDIFIKGKDQIILGEEELYLISKLVREKYSKEKWNQKF